jgi:ubiquitin-conjugating enzyme E2 Q
VPDGGARPGFVPFGADAFALSVSAPVTALPVPARALAAWDRALLARPRRLCLLIAGFRGVYPALAPDGRPAPAAERAGAKLTFRVGLSRDYKPGRTQAADVARSFALVADEEEPVLPEHAVVDPFDDEDDLAFEPAPAPPAKDAPADERGLFEPFALSAALERLLNDRFLRVLQARLAFGLGWAGGEALVATAERLQLPPAAVAEQQRHELRQADAAERELARSYALPLDPLRELGRRPDGAINLPLVAFAYTLRRFMVSVLRGHEKPH